MIDDRSPAKPPSQPEVPLTESAYCREMINEIDDTKLSNVERAELSAWWQEASCIRTEVTVRR